MIKSQNQPVRVWIRADIPICLIKQTKLEKSNLNLTFERKFVNKNILYCRVITYIVNNRVARRTYKHPTYNIKYYEHFLNPISLEWLPFCYSLPFSPLFESFCFALNLRSSRRIGLKIVFWSFGLIDNVPKKYPAVLELWNKDLRL